MAPVELNIDTLPETVKDNSIVLVDLWASWCGPCMRFAPVYDAAAEKHPDVVFGKVDTEAERDLAAALDIQAIPTLMAFRDGILVYRESGALSEQQLDNLIQQVQDLDMDEVKAQVAAQSQQAPQN